MFPVVSFDSTLFSHAYVLKSTSPVFSLYVFFLFVGLSLDPPPLPSPYVLPAPSVPPPPPSVPDPPFIPPRNQCSTFFGRHSFLIRSVRPYHFSDLFTLSSSLKKQRPFHPLPYHVYFLLSLLDIIFVPSHNVMLSLGRIPKSVPLSLVDVFTSIAYIRFLRT